MQRAYRGSSNRGKASNSDRHWSRTPGISSVDSRPRPRDNVKEVEGPDQAKRAKIEENTIENKIPKVSRTRIEWDLGHAKQAKIEENTMENEIPIVSRTRIEETLRDIKCCDCRRSVIPREMLLLLSETVETRKSQNFSEKITVYVCHPCQEYKCERCFINDDFHTCDLCQGGGLMKRDSNLELLALSWLEFERQNMKAQQKELKTTTKNHVDFSSNYQCHYTENAQ